MAYKIAMATSDGVNINETFGSATAFYIYEVIEDKYTQSELRPIKYEINEVDTKSKNSECLTGCASKGCKNQSGCGGSQSESQKVALIADCRCVVCKKIGFHVQKQLERHAIIGFDIGCSVEEALQKISSYFNKIDRHQSLRGYHIQEHK